MVPEFDLWRSIYQKIEEAGQALNVLRLDDAYIDQVAAHLDTIISDLKSNEPVDAVKTSIRLVVRGAIRDAQIIGQTHEIEDLLAALNQIAALVE